MTARYVYPLAMTVGFSDTILLQLLSAARSVEHRTEARLIAQVEVSSTSSSSPFTVLPIVPATFVPALALEEARLVTERFLTAVREVEEPRASTPSLDEGL